MSVLPFNFSTAQFDADNALALAVASNIAYNVNFKKAEQDLAATLGTDRFEPFDVRNTQGFLVGNDDFLILAFRGSEQKWGDWMDDFRIAPVPFDYLFPCAINAGLVHSGFGHAFRDALPDIKSALGKLQTKGQPLWITGHSLGAADAVIAAALFLFDRSLRVPVNGLYTFGQPRVGDNTFGNNFTQRFGRQHYRFVNNADIVTRIPPRELGYVHHGQLIYFDDTGIAHTDEGWWNSFLTEVKVGLDGARNMPIYIHDHDLQTGYIDHISQYQRDLAAGRRDPLKF